MRKILEYVLDVVGLAMIAVGGYLIYPPVGWIVGGGGMLLLAFEIQRTRNSE